MSLKTKIILASCLTLAAAFVCFVAFTRIFGHPTDTMATVQPVDFVFLAALSLSSLLATIVLVTFLSRSVLRPLDEITKVVDRIREGDVSARITNRYDNELRDLANAINETAEKLSLDIANLKRLERVRSEFLGNVSHELRTPIFSMLGFLETLLDGAVDDPQVNRQFLEKALNQGERLNTLLGELIEISRIESGEMKMSFRYFSINDMLRGLIDEMKPGAETKQIALSLESAFDDAAKVYGDQARLRQALTNLIDNAIKYSGPGASVECIAHSQKNQCTVLVRDSGRGISGEHLPRIFERFYRVDRDRSREIGGTGLGLAIVKHIIEAHGSVVNVSSKPGKGTTFSFTLKR